MYDNDEEEREVKPRSKKFTGPKTKDRPKDEPKNIKRNLSRERKEIRDTELWLDSDSYS